MRLLCINASNIMPYIPPLIYLEEYTGFSETEEHYELRDTDGRKGFFSKERFIILSDKDEVDIKRERVLSGGYFGCFIKKQKNK